MGKHEEALEYCDHALEISPKSRRSGFYRGIILTKMDKFEEALESYDRSMSLNPRNLKTLNKGFNF
jgi:tetratricopeptide (TPR) repeat protein